MSKCLLAFVVLLSPTFAANIGPDAVTVRTGPLTIPANSFTGGPCPNPFGPTIDFTTPFLYTGGDLLLTIRHTGNGLVNAFFDAKGADSTIQGQGAVGFGAAAADGVTLNGTVAQFTFGPVPAAAAVPEPSSLSLLALGGLGLAGWRRWRGKRPSHARTA